MYDTLELNIDNGIANVLLNRPQKHNAINLDMFRELGEVGEFLSSNEDVRVVILSGNGRSFCAGIDLHSMGELTKNGSFDEMALKPLEGSASNFFQRAATIWHDMPVPVVAAIHGACLGGGMQICLGCDVRIASPDACFSIMELKWGIIPDMGISITLPRLINYEKAMELTMTNRKFSSNEALDLGIVSKVTDSPTEESRLIADEILKKSPDAIYQLKRLYKAAWSPNKRDLLSLEATLQTSLMGGENQMEAGAANFSNRAPIFTPMRKGLKS